MTPVNIEFVGFKTVHNRIERHCKNFAKEQP